MEAPENGDPIKLRLQEAIASSLTWTSRIDPSRRRILNAMVPQVIKMVASEDTVKLARFVAKTLHSAIANAENNNKLRPETLRIKEAVAGTATTIKRFQPKARGSAGPILKRRCHIKITLSDE